MFGILFFFRFCSLLYSLYWDRWCLLRCLTNKVVVPVGVSFTVLQALHLAFSFPSLMKYAQTMEFGEEIFSQSSWLISTPSTVSNLSVSGRADDDGDGFEALTPAVSTAGADPDGRLVAKNEVIVPCVCLDRDPDPALRLGPALASVTSSTCWFSADDGNSLLQNSSSSSSWCMMRKENLRMEKCINIVIPNLSLVMIIGLSIFDKITKRNRCRWRTHEAATTTNKTIRYLLNLP